MDRILKGALPATATRNSWVIPGTISLSPGMMSSPYTGPITQALPSNARLWVRCKRGTDTTTPYLFGTPMLLSKSVFAYNGGFNTSFIAFADTGLGCSLVPQTGTSSSLGTNIGSPIYDMDAHDILTRSFTVPTGGIPLYIGFYGVDNCTTPSTSFSFVVDNFAFYHDPQKGRFF